MNKRLVDEAYATMRRLSRDTRPKSDRLVLQAVQRFNRRRAAWEKVHEAYWDREEAERMATGSTVA